MIGWMRSCAILNCQTFTLLLLLCFMLYRQYPEFQLLCFMLYSSCLITFSQFSLHFILHHSSLHFPQHDSTPPLYQIY